MKTTLESVAETLGREWAHEWANVGRGWCECGEFLPLGERDGVRLCVECLADGTSHEYMSADEIAQRLAYEDEFGALVPASPSEVEAFRRAVVETLPDVVTWLVDIDGLVTVKCSAVPDRTWNGFAVPVFNRDQLLDALHACVAQGWVRHESDGSGSWAQWVDTEHGEPVVTDLGHDEFILGEGWCWYVVDADEVTV